MTRGRRTCKILKEIRQQIAEKNDIELVTSECHFQGECQGTCPKCEAELRYLENELLKRRQLGKAVAVAGISLGIASTVSACNFPKQEMAADIDTIPLAVQIDWKSMYVTGMIFGFSFDDTTIVKRTIDGRYIYRDMDITETVNLYHEGNLVYRYELVDIYPKYPGGDEALIKFVKENIIYPEDLKEQKIEGMVELGFVVEKDGSITNVEVRKSSKYHALDEEAMRLIQLTKWKPGEKDGKIVRTQFRMPLTVALVNDEERIWDIVDIYPEYPGGEKARLTFLKKNIICSKEAKEKGIEGWIEFVVEKDGSLSNFRGLWGWSLEPNLEEEALRVAKMMPKWNPGKINGKTVRVRYLMPITFKLEEK